MSKYRFTFTEEEKAELKQIVQKGGKGYRIKHAQILLKLEDIPENKEWTYNRIQNAYNACHNTIAGIAHRFVFDGLEGALGRKKRTSKPKFITGEVEAMICAIACSKAPDERSHWTMQMIANELILLKVVETISDTAVCDVMKKMKSNHGSLKNGASLKQAQTL